MNATWEPETFEARELLKQWTARIGEPTGTMEELQKAVKAILHLNKQQGYETSELIALAEALQYLGRYTWSEAFEEFKRDVYSPYDKTTRPQTKTESEGYKRLQEVYTEVVS